jgi:glycosyltransferase involved in cell wall biosynthesis
MRKAKDFGAVLIWEGGCHPQAYQEVYRMEAALAGIMTPLNVTERSARRMEEEISLADAIIVTSNSARSTFINRGVPGNKVSIVPLGWEPRVFAVGSRKKSGEPVRLLFVGRISIFKGIRYLLDAFAMLRKTYGDRVILDIVGPLQNDVSPLVKNLPKGVKLLGRKRQEELKEYYSCADIFVFPSLIEGSAMVVYEAMGSGLPIVTTTMAGSVVRDGLEGLLVPVGDAKYLADQIALLVDNPELREQMGENAKRRAMEFTWDAYQERLVAQISNLYRTITNN